MAKRFDPLMADDYGLDYDPNSKAAISKLPNNVTGGASVLSEYMSIPVNKIKPYSGKEKRDFSDWPSEKFQELVESIKAVGILEAVTVRVAPDDEDMYEMLAGEHRWRAAMEAGLESIPAHVMRKCDDQMADSIFYVTNLLRREMTLRDKILGWSHYVKLTRYKRAGVKATVISEMVETGMLPQNMLDTSVQYRRIYRYAKLDDLRDEYIDAIEAGKITIVGGEQLSYLDKTQQKELLPYIDKIKDNSMCKTLSLVARDREEGVSWSKEWLESFMNPKAESEEVEKSKFSYVMKSTKTIIKQRLNPQSYKDAESIINEALTLYFEKHPEDEMKKPEKKSKKKKDE